MDTLSLDNIEARFFHVQVWKLHIWMDTLSPNNIIISIFSSNSENPIDRSHLAMEGGPVSAKICLTCIFFWIDPPQFRHSFWGMFWEKKSPFLSFPHLRRKSLLGIHLLCKSGLTFSVKTCCKAIADKHCGLNGWMASRWLPARVMVTSVTSY